MWEQVPWPEHDDATEVDGHGGNPVVDADRSSRFVVGGKARAKLATQPLIAMVPCALSRAPFRSNCVTVLTD